MYQDVRVEADNLVCSCIQNDDLQYVGQMKAGSSGEASLCLRNSARTAEHTGSYVMRIADTGLRNPFGKTQEELPKTPAAGSSSGDLNAEGAPPSAQFSIAEDEPPLTRWPAQAYLVKGVLVSRHNAVAIVAPPEEIIDSPPTNPDDGAYGGEESFSMDGSGTQDPFEEYVVKVGESLGNNGGKIVSIDSKGLAVLEGTDKVDLPVTR